MMTTFDAYLACAFWTFDEAAPDVYSRYDLTEESLISMKADVADFFALVNREVPNWCEYWTPEQLGHNFWLSRNGYLMGFRYRAAEEGLAAEVGQQLDDLAKRFGPSEFYAIEGGQIGVTPLHQSINC